MSIQKQFILRHRDDGHVRFHIPAQFCQPETAQALATALLKLDGVYRVKVYRGQQKLSIRYQESFLAFKTLAKQLFDLVAELAKQPVTTEKPKQAINLIDQIKQKVSHSTPSLCFRQKYDDAKETVQAAKILVNGLNKNKAIIDNPQRFITDFFNDILALYLIKLHWEHITKEWIPRPWKYRYEWLAVTYLLYLLMRSRNPKS